MDGTPILDIKPYVPYADSLPEAQNQMADAPPLLILVDWQPEALVCAQQQGQRLSQPLVELIEQCLAQDPRPAYSLPSPERQYGTQFWDVEVKWHYPTPERIRVLAVTPAI